MEYQQCARTEPPKMTKQKLIEDIHSRLLYWENATLEDLSDRRALPPVPDRELVWKELLSDQVTTK